jgi:phosphate starvation-inducible PhoH-like protein
VRRQLELENEVATELAGANDAVMKTLEGHLACDVFLRGNLLTLDGERPDIEAGETVVRELSDLIRQGHEIAPGTIEAIASALDRHESPSAILEDVVWSHRGLKVAPKTVNQKRYVDAIRDNTVTVGIGPAGTGKSFLAVAMAVAALSRREVNRIVLTRPAVEAAMLEPERVNTHLERGVIEIAPLAFMRGRTLNDSFIILDEAQNTSPEQIKMFLTRLGFNSKVVVTGDVTQVDLPRDERSGLVVIGDILSDVEDIEFVRLGGEDVVRHKLVQRIVAAYSEHAEQQAPELRRARRQA